MRTSLEGVSQAEGAGRSPASALRQARAVAEQLSSAPISDIVAPALGPVPPPGEDELAGEAAGLAALPGGR